MEELSFENEKARLGGRLRGLRRERGLGLNELARRAGVDQAYLSRVERGQKSATLSLLVKLANALGVTLRDLF